MAFGSVSVHFRKSESALCHVRDCCADPPLFKMDVVEKEVQALEDAVQEEVQAAYAARGRKLQVRAG